MTSIVLPTLGSKQTVMAGIADWGTAMMGNGAWGMDLQQQRPIDRQGSRYQQGSRPWRLAANGQGQQAGGFHLGLGTGHRQQVGGVWQGLGTEHGSIRKA